VKAGLAELEHWIYEAGEEVCVSLSIFLHGIVFPFSQ
jgi:hypothetical protein